jgi:solute carrier family 4 anion exchanger 2
MGAYLDIMHRLRHYPSDWTDALNPKCVTSIVFMFFAAFAPALTFGGLVGGCELIMNVPYNQAPTRTG